MHWQGAGSLSSGCSTALQGLHVLPMVSQGQGSREPRLQLPELRGGMASSLFVDFHADVLALTQGNPCASLLPLLKQLKGWDEVSRLSYNCCMTVL